MKTNADGSLMLYIQHDSPRKGKGSNWLPAADGPIYAVMRLDWPKEAALRSEWKPPAVIVVAKYVFLEQPTATWLPLSHQCDRFLGILSNDPFFDTVKLCHKLISAPRLALGSGSSPRNTPSNEPFRNSSGRQTAPAR